MIDLRPLFTANFWLNLGPQAPSDRTSVVIFVVIAVMIASGIVVRILRRRVQDKLTRVLVRRVGSALMAVGLVALVWFFFHYEQIRFFGARFWLGLIIIWAIMWTDRLVRFVRRDMVRMREHNAQSHAEAKYHKK